MDDKTKPTEELFSLERLNGLSDGVIAIAITLLVLAIDIPTDHDFSNDGLKLFLAKLEPSFLAYAASFIVVAIYWVQHYAIFKALKYSNQTFMWLNILFLFAISIAPFISKLKMLYRFDPEIILMFSVTNIFTGLILYGMWKYIVVHPELLKEPISKAQNKKQSRSMLLIPLVCLFAIPLTYYDIKIGAYIFMTVPLFYIALQRYNVKST